MGGLLGPNTTGAFDIFRHEWTSANTDWQSAHAREMENQVKQQRALAELERRRREAERSFYGGDRWAVEPYEYRAKRKESKSSAAPKTYREELQAETDLWLKDVA